MADDKSPTRGDVRPAVTTDLHPDERIAAPMAFDEAVKKLLKAKPQTGVKEPRKPKPPEGEGGPRRSRGLR